VTGWAGDVPTVYALDAATGATVWSVGALAGGNAPAANGLIFFGTAIPCSVTAFDALTGTRAWEADLCGELVIDQQAGAVSGGRLFGQFYGLDALDASTGALGWTTYIDTGLTPDGAPALANGMVYLATSDLAAYDQDTGRLAWSQSLGGSDSSPAVANGVVYMGTEGGTLRAYDAMTGSLLWESSDLGDQVSSPAVSDGLVYVGTLDGVVHAFGLP
jgi:outer membrane protein assembly factor BamB